MLNLDRVRKIKKGEYGLTTPQLQYDYTSGSFVLSLNWKDRLNNLFFLDATNLPNPYMNGNSVALFLKSPQGLNLMSNGVDMLNNTFFSDKDSYDTKYGGWTLTGDLLINAGTNAVMMFNPALGLALKGANLLGNALGKLGGSTDGMTKADAILNTGMGNFLTLGLNGFLGKRTRDFAIDNQTRERAGNSYVGSYNDIDEAASLANKKFGFVSGKARRKAEGKINYADSILDTITGITDNAYERQLLTSNMSLLNNLRYNTNLNGGIDLRYLISAKLGDKILRIKKLLLHKVGGVIKLSINVNTKQIEEWSPTITECLEEDTIKLLNGGTVSKQARDFYKDYNLDNVIVIKDSNPRTEDNTIYINTDEDEIHELWHYLSNNKPNENLRQFYENLNDDKIKLLGGDLEFINRMGDPGIFYHPSEIEARLNAAKFKTIGLSYTKEFFKNLRNNENQYGYNMRDLLHMYNDENLEKLFNMKNGGTIEWLPTIELMLEGGEINKLRTLAELIKYAKLLNPRFILRLSESPKGIDFIDDEGKLSRGSHYLEWGTDDKGNAIIYPRILEVDGLLKFFNHTDAYNRAIENNNYLTMTPDEAKIFFAEDSKYGTAYKSGWPEFFKSFKNGGKTEELESPKIEETNLKNIIPEGALHAHKHHMENADNLTKKGIPVIDNEGELLAEIEKNEIIFTLEVTKKLEELMKDGSDDAAIEAGKLLVKEILFNTEDRTGLIGALGKGGVIDVVS